MKEIMVKCVLWVIRAVGASRVLRVVKVLRVISGIRVTLGW